MKNKFFTFLLCATGLVLASCSDTETPSEPIKIVIDGATIAPEVGGPNQPNQVYIDLSTNTSTAVKRDSWDLGFYSGTDFRVVLNSSIYMAAAKLSMVDIDAVNATTPEIIALQPQVAVGTFDDANRAFVDAPNGDLSATAIQAISDTDANNYVYLVNLGFQVGTETPPTGSAIVSGDARGWKKIRILKDGNEYVLQYADLNDTSHKEVRIAKDSNYNFSFFSFDTENEVNIEPEKGNWDLNFTVFTNEIQGFGSYGFTDFVINNSKIGAKVYGIDTTEEENLFTYDNFTIADVNTSQFEDDQRAIGSSWRIGGGPNALPTLKEGIFYVVNDTDGNLYKLKFIAFTNEAGERGYPQFVYKLLE